jgi:hypothetical protein
MDRSELKRCLEHNSFELRATETLPVEQRYIVNRLDEVNDGYIYQILGSKGSCFTVSSNFIIPPQPFLILKMSSTLHKERVYKAISISKLESLCEIE